MKRATIIAGLFLFTFAASAVGYSFRSEASGLLEGSRAFLLAQVSDNDYCRKATLSDKGCKVKIEHCENMSNDNRKKSCYEACGYQSAGTKTGLIPDGSMCLRKPTKSCPYKAGICKTGKCTCDRKGRGDKEGVQRECKSDADCTSMFVQGLGLTDCQCEDPGTERSHCFCQTWDDENDDEDNCVLDCKGVCNGKAKKDECGVCGGKGIPKGKCDCDGNVLDCKGVCGGNTKGLDCCDAFGIDVKRFTLQDDKNEIKTEAPDCLKKMADNCLRKWKNANMRDKMFIGTCLQSQLADISCGDKPTRREKADCRRDFLHTDPRWYLNKKDKPIYQFYTVSKDCKTVKRITKEERKDIDECMVATISRFSPISLLLDGNNFGTDITYTQFPLDPEQEDAWYVWKASDKAPLLVYDPEHEGNITSAYQLFGDWTFGDQWENGFKALGTLDEDNDGEVSGEELEPLALWFDSNRDGISQKGEVRTLDTEGITALYYQNTNQDDDSYDVYAKQGYEAHRNGKIRRGAAVDWYGNSADSRVQLSMYELMSSLSESDDREIQKKKSSPLQGSLLTAQIVGKEVPYDGAWEWKEDEGEQSGLITISGTDEEGKIKGISLIEVPIAQDAPKSLDAPNLIIAIPFSGTAVRSEDTYKIEFIAPSGEENMSVTHATLNLESGKLTGSTSVVDKETEEAKFTYTWSGERVKGDSKDKKKDSDKGDSKKSLKKAYKESRKAKKEAWKNYKSIKAEERAKYKKTKKEAWSDYIAEKKDEYDKYKDKRNDYKDKRAKYKECRKTGSKKKCSEERSAYKEASSKRKDARAVYLEIKKEARAKYDDIKSEARKKYNDSKKESRSAYDELKQIYLKARKAYRDSKK